MLRLEVELRDKNIRPKRFPPPPPQPPAPPILPQLLKAQQPPLSTLKQMPQSVSQRLQQNILIPSETKGDTVNNCFVSMEKVR